MLVTKAVQQYLYLVLQSMIIVTAVITLYTLGNRLLRYMVDVADI
jgi:hypothetical protein